MDAARQRLGWAAAELAKHRKDGPEKIFLAGLLGVETTMNVKWFAAEVTHGQPATGNNTGTDAVVEVGELFRG